MDRRQHIRRKSNSGPGLNNPERRYFVVHNPIRVKWADRRADERRTHVSLKNQHYRRHADMSVAALDRVSRRVFYLTRHFPNLTPEEMQEAVDLVVAAKVPKSAS